MNGALLKGDAAQPPEIAEIAKWVLGISGAGILIVALVTLAGAAWSGSEQFANTSQSVFNALLPLLGTWVGTVLAYLAAGGLAAPRSCPHL